MKFFISILIIIIEPILRIGSRFVSFAFNLNGNKAAALVRGRVYGLYFGCKKLRFEHNVLLVYPQNIILGNHVNIHNSVNLLSHPSSNIIIGDHSHIAKDSIVSGLAGVNIGRYCAISSGVRIYTVSNEFTSLKIPITNQYISLPVEIGNNVFIGANAVILPGTKIQDDAVIAAGAVVNRDVDRHEIVGGQPLRHIKYKDV